MSLRTNLVLVMGRGLVRQADGSIALDESSYRMVKAAVSIANSRQSAYFVFAAPVSPEFGGLPLGRLMMDMFCKFISKERATLLQADFFDSRGELTAFEVWIRSQRFSELSIVASAWHIPRIKIILRQEWGEQLANQVTFYPVAEEWSRLAHVKEWSKRYVHVYIPPHIGRQLVKVLQSFGLRTSW